MNKTINSHEQDENFKIAGVVYKIEEVKNKTTYLVKKVHGGNTLENEDLFRVGGNTYIVSYSDGTENMVVEAVPFNPFKKNSYNIHIEEGC